MQNNNTVRVRIEKATGFFAKGDEISVTEGNGTYQTTAPLKRALPKDYCEVISPLPEKVNEGEKAEQGDEVDKLWNEIGEIFNGSESFECFPFILKKLKENYYLQSLKNKKA